MNNDLINCTRDEASDVLAISENHWKCGAKSWSCLDRWKANFTNAVRVSKTKNSLGLVYSHTLLNTQHIAVEVRTRAVIIIRCVEKAL